MRVFLDFIPSNHISPSSSYSSLIPIFLILLLWTFILEMPNFSTTKAGYWGFLIFSHNRKFAIPGIVANFLTVSTWSRTTARVMMTLAFFTFGQSPSVTFLVIRPCSIGLSNFLPLGRWLSIIVTSVVFPSPFVVVIASGVVSVVVVGSVGVGGIVVVDIAVGV